MRGRLGGVSRWGAGRDETALAAVVGPTASTAPARPDRAAARGAGAACTAAAACAAPARGCAVDAVPATACAPQSPSVINLGRRGVNCEGPQDTSLI